MELSALLPWEVDEDKSELLFLIGPDELPVIINFVQKAVVKVEQNQDYLSLQLRFFHYFTLHYMVQDGGAFVNEVNLAA
jgi:hypothetical protein